MNVTIDFDANKVARKRIAHIQQRQVALDIQVAKDSNYFCPERDGDLIASVMNSNFGSGELVYDEIYARKQYYEAPNKSKDKNPNARMKWFEEAKMVHRKDWLEIARG